MPDLTSRDTQELHAAASQAISDFDPDLASGDPRLQHQASIRAENGIGLVGAWLRSQFKREPQPIDNVRHQS